MQLLKKHWQIFEIRGAVIIYNGIENSGDISGDISPDIGGSNGDVVEDYGGDLAADVGVDMNDKASEISGSTMESDLDNLGEDLNGGLAETVDDFTSDEDNEIEVNRTNLGMDLNKEASDEISNESHELFEAEACRDNLQPNESDVNSEHPKQTLSERLNDDQLFNESKAGVYQYSENELGKSASGSLILSDNGIRNQKAQLEAGGEDRKDDDDGGHLIGTRFEGSPELENIDAQNRNVNRGNFKQQENNWAEHLKQDEKVFVNIDTYKTNGSDRPEAYMGYSIIEDTDGNRKVEAFSYQNQSNTEQEEWEDIVNETDIGGYENPREEVKNYSEELYENEMDDELNIKNRRE